MNKLELKIHSIKLRRYKIHLVKFGVSGEMLIVYIYIYIISISIFVYFKNFLNAVGKKSNLFKLQKIPQLRNAYNIIQLNNIF